MKEKVNEGKERVFFGPRRGIGYSLLSHVLINMGFPYLATWGRAFSAVENPLPLSAECDEMCTKLSEDV